MVDNICRQIVDCC